MKKKYYKHIQHYLTLVFSIIIALFSFLPLFLLKGNSYNLYQALSSNDFPTSLKVLLNVMIFLPFAIEFVRQFYKEKVDALSLIFTSTIFTIVVLYPSMYEVVTETALGVSFGIIIILILLGFILVINLSTLFSNVKFSIRDMVEIGILIAFAIIFDFFPKIKISGGAGSISLTMLPLFIVSLRFGFTKSFIANGIIYGLLTCLFDGYGFATYPFDYLLGFGLISVTSLFKTQISKTENKFWVASIFLTISVILVAILRVLASTLSSILIYQYTLGAGIIYNISYMLPSFGIVLVIMLLLLPTIQRLNRRFPPQD